MIKQVLALPILYMLSWVIRTVVWLGKRVYPSRLYKRAFDWLIGYDNAVEIRNDHAEAMLEALEAKDIEYTYSKQKLIYKAHKNHRDSLSQISRGESVLGILIGFVAILPIDIPSPLPPKNVVILLLVVILVISTSFREAAFEPFAFHGSSVFDSHELLDLKQAWNAGYLTRKRMEYIILMLEVHKEIDERFYQLYLEIIADKISRGSGLPLKYFLKEYWPKYRAVIVDKYLTD